MAIEEQIKALVGSYVDGDGERFLTVSMRVAVYVDDLGRSRRFYQDLFAFEIEVSDDRLCILRVPGRQAIILLPKRIAAEPGRPSFAAGMLEGVIPPHSGGGRLHLVFGITAAELPVWERRLGERGIASGRRTGRRGGRDEPLLSRPGRPLGRVGHPRAVVVLLSGRLHQASRHRQSALGVCLQEAPPSSAGTA